VTAAATPSSPARQQFAKKEIGESGGSTSGRQRAGRAADQLRSARRAAALAAMDKESLRITPQRSCCTGVLSNTTA